MSGRDIEADIRAMKLGMLYAEDREREKRGVKMECIFCGNPIAGNLMLGKPICEDCYEKVAEEIIEMEIENNADGLLERLNPYA